MIIGNRICRRYPSTPMKSNNSRAYRSGSSQRRRPPTPDYPAAPTRFGDLCLHLVLSRENWGGDVGPLVDGPLRAFLSFWMEAPGYVATQEISISPKGRVQASWYGEDSDSPTIEFQENGETIFVFWSKGSHLKVCDRPTTKASSRFLRPNRKTHLGGRIKFRPIKAPTFGHGKRLARSIHPDDHGRKPSVHQRGPDEECLSVNSSEIQTEKQIAKIFSERWFRGERPVAMKTLTTDSYCEAGIEIGCPIQIETDSRRWYFGGPGVREPAFKHRPKHRASPGNPSHYGC